MDKSIWKNSEPDWADRPLINQKTRILTVSTPISIEQWLCWGTTDAATSWLWSWSPAACGALGSAILAIPTSITPFLHRPPGSLSCEPTTRSPGLRSISSSAHELSCSTKPLSLYFSPPINLLLLLPFRNSTPTVCLRIVALIFVSFLFIWSNFIFFFLSLLFV